MMIGYARVSTEGQTLDQQRAALTAAGCKRVFEEKASGAQRGRPELARMLDHLQPGNVVRGLMPEGAGSYHKGFNGVSATCTRR